MMPMDTVFKRFILSFYHIHVLANIEKPDKTAKTNQDWSTLSHIQTVSDASAADDF